MKTIAITTLGLFLTISTAALQAEEQTTGDPIPEAQPPANAVAVSEDTQGKIKTQTITVKDRFGTIEEQRVQSMYSEIRYVPNGSDNGYNLIGAADSNGTINSEHSTSDDELKIPSWKLFSW